LVVAEDRPLAVTYDLRDAADELWGLAVGCNGLLRIFLQPLLPARGYEPFASMAECLRGTVAAAVATVIESADAALPLGTTVVTRAGHDVVFGAASSAATVIAARNRAVAAAPALVAEAGASVLYAPLRPIPQLLVLGAGLDAVPLVGMAAELGWFVTVADHRPAYVARAGFERAERVVLVDADAVAAQLRLEEFAAVVVMSHHLPTDRKYLRQLAAVRIRYVGVLGPRARRERLLADLGTAAGDLPSRLKGPVGLDIGADSPESIALSILAELQSVLRRQKV
jgi:xanthine/CO dehydrogenase XdhC/CoxF family maturation factor